MPRVVFVDLVSLPMDPALRHPRSAVRAVRVVVSVLTKLLIEVGSAASAARPLHLPRQGQPKRQPKEETVETAETVKTSAGLGLMAEEEPPSVELQR